MPPPNGGTPGLYKISLSHTHTTHAHSHINQYTEMPYIMFCPQPINQQKHLSETGTMITAGCYSQVDTLEEKISRYRQDKET